MVQGQVTYQPILRTNATITLKLVLPADDSSHNGMYSVMPELVVSTQKQTSGAAWRQMVRETVGMRPSADLSEPMSYQLARRANAPVYCGQRTKPIAAFLGEPCSEGKKPSEHNPPKKIPIHLGRLIFLRADTRSISRR